MARMMTVESGKVFAKMREIFEHVAQMGMVEVTRYGRVDAVIISKKEYDRLDAEHLELLKLKDNGEEMVFEPGEAVTLAAMERKASEKGWERTEPEPV
jgi:prevent-host-death family protein